VEVLGIGYGGTEMGEFFRSDANAATIPCKSLSKEECISTTIPCKSLSKEAYSSMRIPCKSLSQAEWNSITIPRKFWFDEE
jgi:hypothetical protein